METFSTCYGGYPVGRFSASSLARPTGECGLRDYGTASWEGGDPECDHKHENRGAVQVLDRTGNPGSNNTHWQGAAKHSAVHLGAFCKKCGARRIDNQIGSERIPDCLGWARGENCAERDWAAGCHVCRMVLVFRGVRRVLRDDGTLWLNYGDSWASGEVGRHDSIPANDGPATHSKFAGSARQTRKVNTRLPSGNLVGVPWRVALALQADGWILRQDIIWAKPSPMPESVTNRCTKAHEYVFLLAKKAGYFYDAEAIKERSVTKRTPGVDNTQYQENSGRGDGTVHRSGVGFGLVATSNKRSVWTISSPLMKLRDDLTAEQKLYVTSELIKRGLL